jgi:hypothetical protein
MHRYNIAKNVNTGDSIKCPYCNNVHIKPTYNKIFCSNAKTRKRKNCKDMFWNKIDPYKRCRNTPYFRNVILEKFAMDRGFPTYNELLETSYNDGSWDAHGRVELSICTLCNLRADYCRCGEDNL